MRVNRKPPKNNVRNVQSFGRNLRGVAQNKSYETTQFEFFRDHKLMIMMRKDRTIRDYVSQPEIIKYRNLDGETKDYVPDYKVWRTDGSIELHQTVRLEHKNRPDLQHRDRVIKEICEQRGWRYVVHVEQYMVGKTELANLQALTTFKARCYASAAVETQAFSLLAGGKRLALGDLADTIAAELELELQVCTAALCHALWNETLMTDMHTSMLFVHARPVSRVLVWLPDPSAASEGTRVPS